MARKQSSTIYFEFKNHKEIYAAGHYHDAMYLGSQLVWQKLSEPQEIYGYGGINAWVDTQKRTLVYFSSVINTKGQEVGPKWGVYSDTNYIKVDGKDDEYTFRHELQEGLPDIGGYTLATNGTDVLCYKARTGNNFDLLQIMDDNTTRTNNNLDLVHPVVFWAEKIAFNNNSYIKLGGRYIDGVNSNVAIKYDFNGNEIGVSEPLSRPSLGDYFMYAANADFVFVVFNNGRRVVTVNTETLAVNEVYNETGGYYYVGHVMNDGKTYLLAARTSDGIIFVYEMRSNGSLIRRQTTAVGNLQTRGVLGFPLKNESGSHNFIVLQTRTGNNGTTIYFDAAFNVIKQQSGALYYNPTNYIARSKDLTQIRAGGFNYFNLQPDPNLEKIEYIYLYK